MISSQDVLDVLKATSRTFFIPISRLPHGMQEAIASAYLCMRAIDEIEDHPLLDKVSKIRLLTTIDQFLQAQTSVAAFRLDDISAALRAHRPLLPEVTTRIGEWACFAPAAIAPVSGMPPPPWPSGWLTGLPTTGKSKLRRISIATLMVWQAQLGCCCVICGPGPTGCRWIARMRSSLAVGCRRSTLLRNRDEGLARQWYFPAG